MSKNPIVGIDLGTTHSLIAIVENGKPRVLKTSEGKRLLPSVVGISSQGELTFGYSAKKQKVRDPRKTLFSVKRLLGRTFDDLKKQGDKFLFSFIEKEGSLRICLGNETYTATEVSAMILKELKKSAEKELGMPITRAVITVPAYFNDSQRQDTRCAGRLAGLDVLRILNEPTAAALAYGLDRTKEGLIAVYDLGGGTFDISILKLKKGFFEVLATHGDTTLGGDDIDRVLAEAFIEEISQVWEVKSDFFFSNAELYAQLLEAAERLKIDFSEKTQSIVKIEYQGKTYEKLWDSVAFEAHVKPLLLRTRVSCVQAMQDAGIDKKELADVILVGGSTRLPLVRSLVQEFFEKVPNASVHPDEVVAEGAAIQGALLSGSQQDLLLLDVIPLSLGLETYGGLMSPLIRRNTPIPTVAKEVFTTFADYQTGVDFHILQGDRQHVHDNRSLARFKLKGLKPAPAGVPRIEVAFLVDADGILQVSAQDLHSGHSQMIEVRPSFGLTDSEIEKILASEKKHTQADLGFRQLVEARNEAQHVLHATEKAISSSAFEKLSKEDAKEIQDTVSELKKVLEEKDPKVIQNLTRILSDKTVRLAELMIETLIVCP